MKFSSNRKNVISFTIRFSVILMGLMLLLSVQRLYRFGLSTFPERHQVSSSVTWWKLKNKTFLWEAILCEKNKGRCREYHGTHLRSCLRGISGFWNHFQIKDLQGGGITRAHVPGSRRCSSDLRFRYSTCPALYNDQALLLCNSCFKISLSNIS